MFKRLKTLWYVSGATIRQDGKPIDIEKITPQPSKRAIIIKRNDPIGDFLKDEKNG